jgi:hypothetical protein
MDQDVPLSVLTMAAGAVLGAVLTPFGEVAARMILEPKRRARGLDSAFLLFFAANGVWIIAEIFVEIFVRLDSKRASGWTAVSIAFLFLSGAIIFAVGFRLVPPGEPFRDNRGIIALALKYLIAGNIVWIFAEVIETYAWEFLSAQIRVLIIVATLLLLTAVGIFLAGMRAIWRSSQQQDD